MDVTSSLSCASEMGEGACDLRFVDVTKRYGDFSLRGVSFGVPRGSVVGLVGRNGAGKTTLMRAVAGSVHLDGGRIEAFGSDMGALPDREIVALKRHIAHVGATTALPSEMCVTDVEMLYTLAYPAFDRGEFAALCERLDLDMRAREVKELSRGMGMKLQLACALASGARLLVLDEPTAGLDPIVRDEVLDMLRTWMEGEGRSVLISSHITSDLERLADYLVLLDDGAVMLACRRDHMAEMGVARLRTVELERVLADGLVGTDEVRVLRRGLSYDLLVPSREGFSRAYPAYVCDPATIDDVMSLLIKGEVR